VQVRKHRATTATTAIALTALILVTGCSSSQDGDPEFTETGAASGPYSVNDCATLGSPISSETAPPGLAIDGLVIGGDAVPTISVGPDSVPAVELVSQQLIPGSGASVVVGDTITVNYCGVGQISGALFDSSWGRGEPATFDLVPGGLIEGWTQGVPGMQVGERRLLQIPGDLGYGANPPGGIEVDETLIFVVELVSIG
jgi:peptidylprolyl isomerase